MGTKRRCVRCPAHHNGECEHDREEMMTNDGDSATYVATMACISAEPYVQETIPAKCSSWEELQANPAVCTNNILNASTARGRFIDADAALGAIHIETPPELQAPQL